MRNPAHAILEDLPAATGPVYLTPHVDSPIRLYSGQIELVQDGLISKGRGTVQMAWPPRPEVVVHIRLTRDTSVPQVGPAELSIPESGAKARVSVDGVSLSYGRRAQRPRVTCSLLKDMQVGEGKELACAIFHLPNFREYFGAPVRHGASSSSASRAIFEAEGWRIILDRAEGTSQRFMDLLKRSRGHAITHVGKVERVSGERFRPVDLIGIMDPLTYFLSFCRGNWVSPVLWVGFDGEGRRIWEQWGPRRVERWAGVRSWFSDFDRETLSQVFPGFMLRWCDKAWREPLRMALHWYVESNRCSGGVEGALILAQVAFEFVSWAMSEEARRQSGAFGSKDANAANKLRILLSSSGLELGIPDSLTALRELARSDSSLDGPAIITRVRNAWVHPEPTEQKKLILEDTRIGHQARRLALWYLELVLLRTFSYQGKYANRVSTARCQCDQVELVPWAGR